jgi:ATP-dependent protease HslVU (ClpYQ) ATPase subunit
MVCDLLLRSKLLRNGDLDSRTVEILVTPSENNPRFNSPEQLQEFFRMLQRSQPKRVKMTVREAIPYLRKQEADKLTSMDVVVKEAIESVEQDGIGMLSTALQAQVHRLIGERRARISDMPARRSCHR